MYFEKQLDAPKGGSAGKSDEEILLEWRVGSIIERIHLSNGG